MTKEEVKLSLRPFLPESSIDIAAAWILSYKISLKITKERITKAGDYRHPSLFRGHCITVNRNLNPYAFLITFTHELAHLIVWEKYSFRRIRPHGKEWKQVFSGLLNTLCEYNVFPEEILKALERKELKIRANTHGDMKLSRVLKKYDECENDAVVEDLPEQAVFTLQNGRTYKKMSRSRTRYKCVCLDNNRIYSVHPFAKVNSVLNE